MGKIKSFGTSAVVERKTVHLSDLNLSDKESKQQHDVVKVFLKLAGLWKDDQGLFLHPMRQGDNGGNVIIVPGPAGSGNFFTSTQPTLFRTYNPVSGKSFLIECLVTEAVERYKMRNEVDGYILIVAPTGNAALQAGGYIMQSSSGLSNPVDKQTNFDANHLKPGIRLSTLQTRLNYEGRNDKDGKHLIGIVMDEYSMIFSLQMFWASDRVQQATGIHHEGTQLWSSKTSTGQPIGTLAMYG